MFDRKEWTADVISLEDNGCKLDLRSFNTGGLGQLLDYVCLLSVLVHGTKAQQVLTVPIHL